MSSSLSSSDSSISSLNCCSLEPLVIEEAEVELKAEVETVFANNGISERIVEETEEDMMEEMKADNIMEQKLGMPDPSLSSSSSSLPTSSTSNQAESDDHPKQHNKQPDDSVIQNTEIDDSFNDIEEEIVVANNNSALDLVDNEDSSSLVLGTESSSASPSLMDCRREYEKAKRERRMEQEQAQVEKERMQEILDLCRQFQEQEDRKEKEKIIGQSSDESISTRTSSSTKVTDNTHTKSSDSSSNEELTNNSLYNNPSMKQQLAAKSNENKNISNSARINSMKTTNQQIPPLDTIFLGGISNNKKAESEQLSREKCEIIANLNYLKQNIQDIEMRQNQAIQDLEMERALLDVEHNNQFKNIQNDEAKLKHLQQEHQLRIETFNMHTTQIRNEIEMVQMTMKNVENEILILDTNLDVSYMDSSLSYTEKKHLDSLKFKKQHALEESRRTHEDLEFQLMELEAKYESELEDIQNRLIREQDNLLSAFKQRQVNLNEYDEHQTQMLMQVKNETEYLEGERQKLIEQFKKQRTSLHQIEKKLNKLQEQQDNPKDNLDQSQSSTKSDKSPHSPTPNNDSPSPASSSISLSSATTSNTPPPNKQIDHIKQHYYNTNVTQTPNRYPNSNRMVQHMQTQSRMNQQTRMSQSFRDILDNNFLINGMDEHKSNNSLQATQMQFDQQQFIVLHDTESEKSTDTGTQIALKFKELERSLAKTKAENNSLLEQQLMARERELQLLQNEKRKRSELERQLSCEIQRREKMAQENIQLRHKKPTTQARPLTRYLPVRDNNFNLRQHVENSGHQVGEHTEHLQINGHSCRGYLLKMGQKFKTWNKRWFVFDRQKRTLCYYLDRSETKLRGSIYFQSISEVYVDHMRTIKSPDAKSTFVVKTFDRSFYLVGPSSETMRMWVEVVITGAEGYLEYND